MYLFLALLFSPLVTFGVELNLICTNNYSSYKHVDVKDVFLLLDSSTKKIDLGGLSFYADEFLVTKSNISWTANKIDLYPESKGKISGILGRYSGELVLNFVNEDDKKLGSLIFNCRKFEMKERKF